MTTGGGEYGDRFELSHARGVQLGHGSVQHNTYLLSGPQVAWPHQVGAVPLTADCFQPRPDAADAPGATGTEPVTTHVLTGLGGVGKTQWAAQWARQAQASGELDLLVWVPAATRQAVVAVYAEAAMDVCPGQVADADQAAARFVAWLGRTDRRWMVVLDDVTAPGDLRDLWPPVRSGGTVVVTTRRRDAALAGPGRRLVETELFSAAEAVGYLNRRLGGDPRLLAGAEELAHELGLLPLALAQAGAYMLDQGMSCRAYRARLADRARRLDGLLPESTALPDEQRQTLAVVWSLSVELADKLHPAGLARPSLELSSVLSSQGIPAGLYTSAPARAFLAAARGGQHVDEDDARGAVRCLHRLSLVAAAPDDGPVHLHRLVQRAAREQLAPDRFAEVVRVAADALTASWPEVEREFAVGQTLRTNAQALYELGEDVLWATGDVHEVVLRTGQSFANAGLLRATMAHYRRIAEDAEARLGPDHTRTLAARSNAVRFLALAGDTAAAVAAYEELLADELLIFGPGHPRVLFARKDIADAKGQGGDSAGALELYEGVLEEYVRVLGPAHPETLHVRLSMAKRRNDLGYGGRARAECEELYEDFFRALGRDHKDTLHMRGVLAELQGRAGDPVGAVAAYEELLGDVLRALGADHIDTLDTRHQLAVWRANAGFPAAAAAELEILLADYVRVCGPNHLNVSSVRFDLSLARNEAGDALVAPEGIVQSVADMEPVLGPEHPLVVANRALAATWHQALLESDPVAAAASLEQLIGTPGAALVPNDPMLEMRVMLAEIRGITGAPAATVEEFGVLLDDCLRLLGAEHSRTLSVRASLAEWRGRAGEYARSVAELDAVRADAARLLGPEHPETLRTHGLLAERTHEAGDLEGAIALYEELLGVRRRVLGADHPDTLRLRCTLVDLRTDDAEPAESLPAYEDLLADHLRVLGPDHPRTLDVRSQVIVARGETGDVAGAVVAYEELLRDYRRLVGPEHVEMLAPRVTYGALLAKTGDHAGSVAAYEDILSAAVRIWGTEHMGTFMLRGCLAEARGHLDGHPESAVPAFESLLADCVRVLGPDDSVTAAVRAYLAGLRRTDDVVPQESSREGRADEDPPTFNELLTAHGKDAWSRRAAGTD
ncbi:tetratricopeptide repeat protein [Streptomyces sp. KhCrAH-43]|uniref:tetratricopeptide repeat protein n=1 Tax=unclassified Streptomyces TaxID=2593676 RepID=UPI00035DF20E|nr:MULTISPECIES: tetratricopeptide repeat protein [unclassified Streptomyces]MYS39607.1 tetratricopeptide repeat protein [Streptomyces sp. SID4920]MYX70502.1 tetratricopeptide repeat protein [Streptomyces sp. SID8373]RAJ48881.1 tetratricopeptide repeat protein [Streptomyces sp. KhCrAH-43]